MGKQKGKKGVHDNEDVSKQREIDAKENQWFAANSSGFKGFAASTGSSKKNLNPGSYGDFEDGELNENTNDDDFLDMPGQHSVRMQHVPKTQKQDFDQVMSSYLSESSSAVKNSTDINMNSRTNDFSSDW